MKSQKRGIAFLLALVLMFSSVSTIFATENTGQLTDTKQESTAKEENEDVAEPQEPQEDASDDAAADSGIEEDELLQAQPESEPKVETVQQEKPSARAVKAAVTIANESQLADSGLFPDPVFRKAVFKAVEGCSGATLEEALASFTGDIISKGSASHPGGIADIHGIEYLKCANLVDVSHNMITDWSFLSKSDAYWYGVADGTDRDGGRNVYWIISGNPFQTLPVNFGGALVIEQPGTTSSKYSAVDPEEKKIVLRNEPGKTFNGELDILKCKVGDRPVKILEDALNVVKGEIKVQKISDEKISYSGLRKCAAPQIGIGVDQKIHYDTLDEYGTSTPGSQSFKYYVFPEFFVYDRVKIETVNTGSVELVKTDEKTGDPVTGAVFSLFKADNTLVKANLTTDRNGKITETGLGSGSYYFKETKAPMGYELSAEKRAFTITPSSASAGITGLKEITTDDAGKQTAAANEAFIAGKGSVDVGLTAPAGLTVKSVKVNYSSLDAAEASTAGTEVNTTFQTLAEAQADINAKQNANLITGPVSVKVDAVDTTQSAVQVSATNKPELVTIKGTKTWVDKVGTAAHPDVTLRLLQNGQPFPKENPMTVVLTNGMNDYEFKDLPEYGANGAKNKYTVSEDSVTGYTSQRTATDNGFDFKNTFINEFTELNGTKTWIDEDGFDDMKDVMHSKAKVWLTRNGDKTEQFAEIGGTKEKTEAYSFTKLPVYSKDGKTKYTYGIKEEFESAEEAAKYREPRIMGNNIMNMFAHITTRVYVRKVWDDKGLANAHHPELTFRLLQDGLPMQDKDGKPIVKKLEKDTKETDVWFEELQEYADNGKKYVYTVVEDPVAGYQSSRTSLAASKEKPIGFEFKNTRNEAGKTSITATKDWLDYEGWAGPYPKVTIRLLQNGVEKWGPGSTEVEQTIDKNKGETQAIFTDLAETDGKGNSWEYTVKEVNVPAGYKDVQTVSHITNIFENADKTSVSVEKTWCCPAN